MVWNVDDDSADQDRQIALLIAPWQRIEAMHRLYLNSKSKQFYNTETHNRSNHWESWLLKYVLCPIIVKSRAENASPPHLTIMDCFTVPGGPSLHGSERGGAHMHTHSVYPFLFWLIQTEVPD